MGSATSDVAESVTIPGLGVMTTKLSRCSVTGSRPNESDVTTNESEFRKLGRACSQSSAADSLSAAQAALRTVWIGSRVASRKAASASAAAGPMAPKASAARRRAVTERSVSTLINSGTAGAASAPSAAKATAACCRTAASDSLSRRIKCSSPSASIAVYLQRAFVRVSAMLSMISAASAHSMPNCTRHNRLEV